MGKVVQTRLERETELALDALVKQSGASPSAVVREAIKSFAAQRVAAPRRKFIGLGKFDSGVPDLGSNPDHLRGFGRKR